MRGAAYWVLGAFLAATIAALAAWGSLRAAEAPSGFAAKLDLRALESLAVHTDGRLNSFESFARYTLKFVSGPHRINGQPPVYSYMDMMVRPDAYESADIVWIKNKTMRQDLARALTQAGQDAAWAERFMKTGLISPTLLQQPGVQAMIDNWSRDLIKTAKFVDQIQGAMHLRDPRLLSSQLRVIPPPPMDAGRDRSTPWLSPNELYPQDATTPELVENIPPELQSRLRATWSALIAAWRAEDAPKVNAAIAELSSELHEVNQGLYPKLERLNAESTYFKLNHLTWVWVLYFVAVVFLLMSVAYKWEAARSLGMGAFSVAFLLHTGAVMLRWYVSGRWPNSNMFEAVTTSVWFGAVLAFAIEIVARRTAMRNLFALTAAVASGAALMSAHYLPQLDANIRNMMPVLHDIWLYIHTNVIIASYALIAMAAVTAGLYLVGRFFGAPASYARLGGTDAVMDLADSGAVTPAADGKPLRKVPLGEVLDGATLVLMEMSFVLLWAGIVMGAIWADHSWGRPWGWDPKEVFALNTFLVFLVLIHVRLKVRDKGLWTAVLAVIGCAVMLFNWIVINFVISGLHSYA
ncbi:MAG: cytochrome c biogenesis protein CcsA [Planctomycetes bacterium]|nr:cytochrome c biogenesis protein CcsA [Planctomycetota bacterium]